MPVCKILFTRMNLVKDNLFSCLVSLGTHLSASASTVVEEDGFSLACAASRFRFSNVSWRLSNGLLPAELDNEILIDYWETAYSLWSNISIRVSERAKHSGTYYCIAER